jgi:hypothetical protein
MFLFKLAAKIVETRSKELYDPHELWTYATHAQPEDDTDCEYVAHWVGVTRNTVDAVMAETEALEHFAGWIVRSCCNGPLAQTVRAANS